MNQKRKVLIFGEKVFGNVLKEHLNVDYCDIDLIRFPKQYATLSHLSDYNLVLLDYAAFHLAGSTYEREQEIFEKGMLEALGSGTCFCILHYDEEVPEHNQYNYDDGKMEEGGITECSRKQIGFRWLRKFKIRPYRGDAPIIKSEIKRNEFKHYYEHWGASKHLFEPYYGHGLQDTDIIFRSGNYLVGFARSALKGKILFVPCQRDFSRVHLLAECLSSLINSTITYLTRSSTEIPAFAKAPLFTKEKTIYDELTSLEFKMDKLHKALAPYQKVKNLAFLSEYDFEDGVPKFFSDYLGIPTYRHDEYKEDFWLLDSDSKKIAIAEAKTYVRGFKKGSIYSLYNHREANSLEETFPALLVVNAHLNANSWEEKLRSIDPQDYQVAAKDNILIMRIEDIIFFWNSMQEGKYKIEKLLEVIIKSNGWLEVKVDGSFTIHK